MNDLNKILPLTTVEDVLASLRELVRLARQREVWTQDDLARRSGVPMTTISRLERTGLASTDTFFKVLFALNRLEAVEDMLKEQLRLVKFPKTLDGDFESAPKVVKRVGTRPCAVSSPRRWRAEDIRPLREYGDVRPFRRFAAGWMGKANS